MQPMRLNYDEDGDSLCIFVDKRGVDAVVEMLLDKSRPWWADCICGSEATFASEADQSAMRAVVNHVLMAYGTACHDPDLYVEKFGPSDVRMEMR